MKSDELFGKDYFENPDYPYNEDNCWVAPVSWPEKAEGYIHEYVNLVGEAPKTFLDCGTGYGYTVREMKKLHIESEGFDVSPYAVSKKVTDNVFVSTFDDWSKWDADFILASGSVHYLSALSAIKFIQNTWQSKVVCIENIPKGCTLYNKTKWLEEIEPACYNVLFRSIGWYISLFRENKFFLSEIITGPNEHTSYYFVNDRFNIRSKN